MSTIQATTADGGRILMVGLPEAMAATLDRQAEREGVSLADLAADILARAAKTLLRMEALDLYDEPT
jgi:hypothetical protein